MSEFRQMPQSTEAERAVLCSLMLAPEDVSSICTAEGVTRAYFSLPAHWIIFEALSALIELGKPVEFITLLQKLQDADMLERVGGPAYLSELNAMLPSAANFRHYLDILREKYRRRQIIYSAEEAIREAHEKGNSVDEVASDLHGVIGRLLHRQSARPSVRDSINEIIEEIKNGTPDTGHVEFPIAGIGDRLRLYRGDFMVISAPTSCGKTALAAQFALANCKKERRSAIYPLEMRQRQVIKRAIAQLGGHNVEWLRKLVMQGDPLNPTPHTRQTVGEFRAVAEAILKFKLHIRDDLFRWDAIRADIRTEHAKEPFSFIMIDYLQLIQSNTRAASRQLALAEITQGAKLLAAELDCVICIPSQVNKEGGTREAQDAENDAAALIKIHADIDAAGDVRPGRVSVWKQREGERHGDLPLKFNPRYTRFEETATP